MSEKTMNHLAVMLTKLQLEYARECFDILEKSSKLLTLPDPFERVRCWGHIYTALHQLVVFLAPREVEKDPSASIETLERIIRRKPETWDVEDALETLSHGVETNHSKYHSALYWLINFAPPDTRNLIHRAQLRSLGTKEEPEVALFRLVREESFR